MKLILKIAGGCIAAFGLLLLIIGKKAAVVPGIILTIVGIAIAALTFFSRDISRKRARKELMELKSLLDCGAITKDEYVQKSADLKSKI
jgi:hypothetical protein